MNDEQKVQLALLDFPECECGKDKRTSWELMICDDRSVGLTCIECWATFDWIDEGWVPS